MDRTELLSELDRGAAERSTTQPWYWGAIMKHAADHLRSYDKPLAAEGGTDLAELRAEMNKIMEFYDVKHVVKDLWRQIEERLARPTWRCYHCDEIFHDKHAARNHFGDWGEDVAPGCVEAMTVPQAELRSELQSMQDELTKTRADAEQNGYLVHLMRTELNHHFAGAKSVGEAWQRYESMEGRALAAEERADEAWGRLQAVARVVKTVCEAPDSYVTLDSAKRYLKRATQDAEPKCALCDNPSVGWIGWIKPGVGEERQKLCDTHLAAAWAGRRAAVARATQGGPPACTCKSGSQRQGCGNTTCASSPAFRFTGGQTRAP